MARKSKDVPLRRSNLDLSYNRANESPQSVWIMQELYMEHIRYQDEIMIWKITLTRQWFASLFLRLVSTWPIIELSHSTQNTQVQAQPDCGPGPEIGTGYKIGVTWSRKRSFKMAAAELGYLLTKSPFWLSLWHDISISWHGSKEL